jgi:signal transduction histidine kinase
MLLHSLKARLFGLWGLSLIACVAVGCLLVQLYRQSTEAQVERAAAVVARACDVIRERYGFYTAGWSGPGPRPLDGRSRSNLANVVGLALANQSGVEGGIWQAEPLAYAFPTYEGTGPKTDLPAAERAQIQAVNRQAAHDEQSVDRRIVSGSQTLLLHACPLLGPIAGLTAWTMTRVHAVRGLQPLQLGLGVLLALMVLMSAWLGRTLVVWGRHVRGIEGALKETGAGGLPPVRRTGERELDQIIDALNEAGLRVGEARQQADAMADRAARAERLAALGRVAAGVAHEIRNPIAAARLQGENALAGNDQRRREAIGDMLGQIDRLDDLVGELLAMTQRIEPKPRLVDLRGFLGDQIDRHKVTAAAKALIVDVRDAEGTAVLDPAVIGRVLDNLLTNAIRHAPQRGSVVIAAERCPGLLTLTVADSGAGVPPEMAERLFEPFVTGRPEGTGLGLAISRELADAHGGRLVLRRSGNNTSGALFALELPQEDTWPRS